MSSCISAGCLLFTFILPNASLVFVLHLDEQLYSLLPTIKGELNRSIGLNGHSEPIQLIPLMIGFQPV